MNSINIKNVRAFNWKPKNTLQVLLWIPMVGFYLMNILSNIMLDLYNSLNKEFEDINNKVEE